MDTISNIKHKGEILVVDDEPFLLEGLFDVLEQEGYRVTTCSTVEEAKEISKRKEFKIALIDLKMPNSDGLTLTKDLKQHNPNLGVIVLTAYPSQETAIEALRIGLADYLVKPVNMDELIMAINRALGKREEGIDLESVKTRLYKTQQQLDNMKTALVKTGKFSSLGQISMELFHEIKNLLAVMNTSIYYLSKNVKQPDSKIQKHIEMIKKQIHHSNQLIMSLLNFSKGKQDKEEELCINQPLSEILELIEPELCLNSIKVVKNLASDLKKIRGNSDKLKQICLNFILNAKDAMPEGGELRISTYNKEDMVVIEFLDTGKGISDEYKHKIFDPFFTTKQNREGVGLGLTVSKSIIENYNGEIIVDSIEGKGSSFIIKFPSSK